MNFFFSRIFPLIFILAGAGAMYLGSQDLVQGWSSREWPTAPGRIVSSVAEIHQSTSSSGRSTATWTAQIRYEFRVEDTVVVGSQVAYGDFGGTQEHANEVVARYPALKEVTVYYMANNPQACLLEPGIQAQAWFLPIFGLIFFAIGSVLAIALPYLMRSEPGDQPPAERPSITEMPN